MAELVQSQRISVFLPVNDASQRFAARRILRRLQQLFPGYTVSTIDVPVFTGSWFNPNLLAAEEDLIAIAFTDVPFASDTDPALLAAIDDIRHDVRRLPRRRLATG